jgi:hypothetical protein
MSRETENEALDKIQDIADVLSTLNDMPADVREGLRIIEALARHRISRMLTRTTMNGWLE